jgi:transposase
MEEPAPEPKGLIADRGYDADAIRQDLDDRGAMPVIPTKKNRKVQIPIDGHIYALRNRIERCFNRLKNARRFATRYDKLAATFHGFVNLVAIRLWLRHFVNAA